MLDNAFLLRSLLIKRTDCLTKSQTLNVLIAIRYLNKIKDRSNYVSIFLFLKKAKRQNNIGLIQRHTALLVSAGYIIRTKTVIRITEAGKQALSDIDKQLKQARYAYGRTKQPAKLGAPKPLY